MFFVASKSFSHFKSQSSQERERKTEKLLSFSMSFPRISSHFLHRFLENRRAQRFVSSIRNIDVENETPVNIVWQCRPAKRVEN